MVGQVSRLAGLKLLRQLRKLHASDISNTARKELREVSNGSKKSSQGLHAKQWHATMRRPSHTGIGLHQSNR